MSKKSTILIPLINFLLMIHADLSQLTRFITSPLSLSNKIKILYKLLIMTIKMPFASILGYKSEKIFGYTLEAFDYKTLRYLFNELFYKLEYYFESNNNNPIIIDLGANIGDSVLFFKWLYPNSTIYAFEPDKNTYSLLQKNVAFNHFENVHLYNLAVSDADGKISFYIDSQIPGSLIMSTKKDRISDESFSVDTIRLSKFLIDHNISHVDCLKMDVEGSEHEILSDIHETRLFEYIDEMIIEYHHRFGTEKSKLGNFLKILEDVDFEYSLQTQYKRTNPYQDILIYATKKEVDISV